MQRAESSTVHPVPASTVAPGLASGELSLDEYIDSCLDRLERDDGAVKALLPEADRRARLFDQAAALQKAWPEPGARPPLFGVLVGVKDIFAVDGFETRAGSKLPPELFAMPEGPVVASLRRAGALILGKTVTTEFAYFAPGPTANPWDTARTPGGSSSGSAAAVAAGFCSMATGTQTIGSISRPAAFCGITGYKPTYERLDRTGVVPFSPSVDHIGFLAPLVADTILAMRATDASWQQADFDTAKARFSHRRPILAVPEGPFMAQAETASIAAFEASVERLRAKGFSILRIPAFADIDDINSRHRRICAADMDRVHRPWFAAHESLYAPATRELIQKGKAIGDNELELDRRGRDQLRNALDRALAEAGADFWICPSAPGPAPLGLDATGSPIMNLPWTHAGVPTLSVPAGLSPEGMPLGLQLAATFGADENLLAAGLVVQSALEG